MIESEIAVPGACGAQLEARTERQTGRKIVTTARMHAEGELTAEAEGLFVVPEDFHANLPERTAG